MKRLGIVEFSLASLPEVMFFWPEGYSLPGVYQAQHRRLAPPAYGYGSPSVFLFVEGPLMPEVPETRDVPFVEMIWREGKLAEVLVLPEPKEGEA